MTALKVNVSPTSISANAQSVDSQTIRGNEKFGEAKAKLAERLMELSKASEKEPAANDVEAVKKEKEKVYALIFINGLHMVMKVKAEDSDEEMIKQKGLAYMEFVRADDPEERYRNLGAKVLDAADLLLAERELSNRVINEFINRRLQENVSHDKLAIYRDARNIILGESRIMSDASLLTVKPSTLRLARA
jgi:hypothetical protein